MSALLGDNPLVEKDSITFDASDDRTPDPFSGEATEDEHVPYVSPDEDMPEVTLRGILLGSFLSIVLGATNVYAGLLAGLTTSASIPAAILSMGFLRLMGGHSILENNQVQTAASAGESLAAGVIFTLPALVLFETDETSPSEGWSSYVSLDRYFTTLVLCWFGGVLGVLFSIPIRKALVVNKTTVDPPLTFPEGVATANVLIQGHEKSDDTRGVKALMYGALIGAFFSLLNEGMGVVKTNLSIGGFLADGVPMLMQVGMSPIIMAIGYIVGWRVSLVMLLGSLVQFMIAIPLAGSFDNEWLVFNSNDTAPDVFTTCMDSGLEFEDCSFTLWSKKTRNLGVGAMLFSSLFVLVDIRKALWDGIVLGMGAFKGAVEHEDIQYAATVPRNEREAPMKLVLGAILACVAVLYVAMSLYLDNWAATLVLAATVLVLGFLFSSVAAFNAGLVGSSNNPVSGVTISSVLLTSGLVRVMLGADNPVGAPISVLVGTVICCASAISGDNLQDLKAGHILGATPYKQVQMQLIGVTVAAFVMAPVLEILSTTYGFGGTEGLSAPQATVMKSVSEGVIYGNLPLTYILIGAGCAAIVIAIDKYLQKRQSHFRMPPMAFAIGFYLPPYVGAGAFAGSLVTAVVAVESQAGLLHAAGMITGYGLMGLVFALVVIVSSLVTGNKESPLSMTTAGIDATTAAFLAMVQLVLVWLSLFKNALTPDELPEKDVQKFVVDSDIGAQLVSVEGLSLQPTEKKEE